MDRLNRIAIHWSVGQYTPNADDLEHYHFLIDDKGVIHKGNKPPESNLASSVKAGTYVQHLGGGNTDTIGVSFASMLGYQGRNHVGNFPITEVQFEAGMKLVAELCHKYNIKVTESTVFSHYEFGKLHPDSPSGGKIDITFLPHKPELKPEEVGNYIRSRVTAYLK
jgi:N-acetylmuramoyl-L-alanine amidase CwlA